MTTATQTVRATRPTFNRASSKLTFPRLIRSEWVKLTTLRSPWWSISVVAVLTLGLGLLAATAMSKPDGASGAGPDPAGIAIQAVLAPTTFTVLLATILGTTLVTSEYATGMIRSTITAAPGRIGAMLSKIIVIGGFVFVTSTIIFTATAAVIAPTLAKNGVYFNLTNPYTSYLPILAGSFMMAVIAIIGISFGYILRTGAGALAGAVGLVFVLPLVPRLFPNTGAFQWVHTASEYLPTGAGGALISSNTPGVQSLLASNLPAGTAALTLSIWVVASVAAAAVCLKSRDA